MKLFFTFLFLSSLSTVAQPITIPGSSFPVTNVPQPWMRIMMVDTNGNASGNQYTRSNATIRYDDLASALATTISGTIGNAANVLQLGVKGGTNDDTVILQSLLSVPGAQYYFPPTNYTLSQVNITNGVQLLGYGATLKLKAGVTNQAIINQAPGVTNNLIQGFRFDGLDYSTANANPASRSGGSSNRMGVNLDVNSVGTVVQNCYYIGLDKGINIFGTGNGSQVFQRGNISLILCEGSSNYYGFYASSTNTGFQVEYITPLQFRMHDCTYGAYINGGNIGLLGADITENWIGVVIDGTGANPAHGFIESCKINHNILAAIACYNVPAGDGEIIANNQIRANSSVCTCSNSAGILFHDNSIDTGNFINGSSGIPAATKGPNYCYNNGYNGFWGVNLNGLRTFDYAASDASLNFDQTTNTIHWGNFSQNVLGDVDPYKYNPFGTNTLDAFATNTIPPLPFTPNSEFLYRSNGQKTFIIRSTGLTWSSTNVAY